jgi:transcriptional regulator with XRE-family HTH domain
MRLLGINKAELGRRSGLGRATLANVFSGNRNVGQRVARALSQGLGIPQDVVFKEFGLMDDGDAADNKDEARLFTELLNDIDDEEEKQKAVGLVTALLRQIAHTARQSKQGAKNKSASGRSKPA